VCVCVCVCMGGCVHTCSLAYPACDAHAPYCHLLCLASPYISTFSHKRHGFRKNVMEHKICVLNFATTLLGTFLIPRRIQRDIVINVETSSCKVPVILVGFYWNLYFLDIFSGKKEGLSIKFHQNPSSGSRVVPCGRMEGYEASSHFLQLCERA
jgi:hypothetical protein